MNKILKAKNAILTVAMTLLGSVANNLFNLKKVEYPIIAKTRFVVFTGFFELVGE
jgi:hypothetical protein